MATWELNVGTLLCLDTRCSHSMGMSVSHPPHCPPQYFILLLLIFLLEIIAGILAYVYYQQVRGWRPHGDTDIDTDTHTRARLHVTPTSAAADHCPIRPWRRGMGHGDKGDCRLNHLCAAPKGAYRGRQVFTESRAFSLPSPSPWAPG